MSTVTRSCSRSEKKIRGLLTFLLTINLKALYSAMALCADEVLRQLKRYI